MRATVRGEPGGAAGGGEYWLPPRKLGEVFRILVTWPSRGIGGDFRILAGDIPLACLAGIEEAPYARRCGALSR